MNILIWWGPPNGFDELSNVASFRLRFKFFDLPTGAVIVCALVTLLIVAVALGELTTLVTGR